MVHVATLYETTISRHVIPFLAHTNTRRAPGKIDKASHLFPVPNLIRFPYWARDMALISSNRIENPPNLMHLNVVFSQNRPSALPTETSYQYLWSSAGISRENDSPGMELFRWHSMQSRKFPNLQNWDVLLWSYRKPLSHQHDIWFWGNLLGKFFQCDWNAVAVRWSCLRKSSLRVFVLQRRRMGAQ